MDKNQVTSQVESIVHARLAGESTGHDWWHVDLVRKNALLIGREEGANLFIVELGALLHDIADFKFNGGDESAGPRATREILESLGVDEEVIAQVAEIVVHVSFKGAAEENKIATLEGRVVQDADRLEALGAIGIARCFAYGGSCGRPIYDPDDKPREAMTSEEYKQRVGTSLAHFYEKLLLIKDRMNTATGRRLAEHRHRVMEDFLREFYAEWEGRL